MTPDVLEALLDLVAERIAERVASKLAADRASGVDQHASDLGTRRHIAACRKRIAAGQHGASKVGRRFLLSRSALAEELERLNLSSSKRKATKATHVAPVLSMQDRLEAARGAR